MIVMGEKRDTVHSHRDSGHLGAFQGPNMVPQETCAILSQIIGFLDISRYSAKFEQRYLRAHWELEVKQGF